MNKLIILYIVTPWNDRMYVEIITIIIMIK